ncbi:MAG: hypothetical protein HOM66_03925 [Rhodospirillales bacterium]|nr:hypothetical protein [Rhodospirillales bacterium]MBT5075782.1 hypothetical protein [Rhodospirillales bacterium]MBT5114385.1 hypothetical protein [Rhodospirillales bacterium]MBT5672777.1 hypothetical protein [Rhodospirillales bacterium]MBT7643789.1 hypothetical protein [Rhodospirillales bacterium]
MIRRTFKILLETLAIIVAGLTVLLILGAVRLSMGPVTLNFLTPYIEAGLTAPDGSRKVSLNETVLIWTGWDRTLDVLVRGLRVSTKAGVEQAYVPELVMGLSMTALINGRFAPARFEIVQPRIKVVRDHDGKFSFGDAGKTGANRPIPGQGAKPQLSSAVSERIIHALAGPRDRSQPLGYLKSVSISDAELIYEDRKLGIMWRSPGSSFVLSRDAGGLGGNAQLVVDADGVPVPVDLAGGYSIATGMIDVGARFKGLDPQSLTRMGPGLAGITGITVPLSGEVTGKIHASGRVDEVTFDVKSGAGSIGLAQLFGAPVAVKSLAFKAVATNNMDRVRIDRLDAVLGSGSGPKLSVSGNVLRDTTGIHLGLSVLARDVETSDVKRFWPKNAVVDGRNWVVPNLMGGRAGRFEGTTEFTLTQKPDGAVDTFQLRKLDTKFDFSDMAVHFLRPLPPLTHLSGTAHLTKQGLDFKVAGGRLGVLQLGVSRVKINGLDQVDQDIDVNAVAHGPLADALKFLDHPELDLVKGFGIDPAKVQGKSATRLVIKFPLEKTLTFKRIKVSAASNLTGVALPNIMLGTHLTDGDLRLQLDKQGMDIKGNIKLGGVAAQLEWTENFYPNARFKSRYAVKGRIDASGRQKFGFHAPDHITGPIGFDAILTRFDKGRRGLSASLDLKDTALEIKDIVWKKKAGVPGFARFSLALEGDRIRRINNLAINAGDLRVRGRVDLDDDGKSIKGFEFSKFSFGANDIRVRGDARKDGGLALSVAGPILDARPFIDAQDEKGPKRPLDIVLDVGLVRVGSGAALASVRGTLKRGTGEWQRVKIQGSVGKDKKPMRLSIVPDGDSKGRTLRIESDDAGAVLKIFDLSKNVVKGKLLITGHYDDTRSDHLLKGKFEVRKFRMVHAPALANLLAVASLTGTLDTLSGEGIAFSMADIPFTKAGNDLRLGRSRVYGNALGFTAKGWIDLEKNSLDVTGTVVPAYTLNAVFGNIPLLGPLLTGEKGSGIFAATYRMKGKIENPDVTINPLATLAPGFLRGLFGIFDAPRSKPPSERKKPQKKAAPKAPKP